MAAHLTKDEHETQQRWLEEFGQRAHAIVYDEATGLPVRAEFYNPVWQGRKDTQNFFKAVQAMQDSSWDDVW